MSHTRVNPLRRWLHEPLLHFVVLGVALFTLHHWVAPPQPGRQIVLSAEAIRGLRQDHLRRYGTLPTADEEAAMIQRFINNEVLYREALALGLDRGDIVVRRRLVQKMQFLTEDLQPIATPTDRQLRAYLDAHAVRYAVPARLTLTHVFVSADRHGSSTAAYAAQLRARLLAGADPAQLGDPFLRGRKFSLSTQAELAAAFGATFAAQVMSLPTGTWSEPLRSSYGLHLVRVAKHIAGHQPSLAEVRDAVERDWREERRTEADRLALARLRQRYDVRIEGADGAAPAQLAVAR
jgi:peptidyl-prolyl cis-trans isomerase C